MFTWICPKCGREVPPAYTECPDCARRAAEAQPSAAEPPAAVPPGATGAATPPAAPPAAPPAQEAVYVRPYVPPPAARTGLPTWLLTVLFAFAFVGVGAGAYWLVGYLRNQPAPALTVESPAAKAGAKTNPLQKYIEVSGVRFIEGPKKNLEVRFVVVNHSPAEIRDLAGNVTIWGRTQKSEEEAAGTFTFATNLGPWETKDLSAPLTSKHKIYELPDWQNVSTDIQITAPASAAR